MPSMPGRSRNSSPSKAAASTGLKLIEVAAVAGMTQSQVSDVQRGKNNPGWFVLMQLFRDGLELSLGDLAAPYRRVGEKA
jgi:transcriptional regulator with XRE-family HTH domain